MEPRKKLAIFIDYSIRTPNFSGAFKLFKETLFKPIDEYATEDASDLEELDGLQGDVITRNYWKEELKNSDCEQFYVKKIIKEDANNYELRNWRPYFFNDAHYKKFIDEYSFNLYSDAETCAKRDIDLINIAQTYLFDIVLIDEFEVSRKKGNTFHFLSKTRVLPQALIFLGPGQFLHEPNYFSIWNPKINKDQQNRDGEGEFENWFKELEQKNKKIK